MPYVYKILSEEEQDDMIVLTLAAQERDHFSHSTNLERFNSMLSTMTPNQWKDRIAQLKADTEQRLGEVTSIIEALTPQLPAKVKLDASVARLKAKGAL